MTNSAQSMTPRHAAEGDPFEGTPYRALSRLASGGMGEVFLVKHGQLGRTLAAKVLHARLANNPTLVERARIEAQSLARLRHANIVAVSGFGFTKDNRPFIVMEYLRGRTLSEELAAVGHLPVSDAVRLTAQLLSALGAAHELGIVHRDIKPSNLFLCDVRDEARVLKVLDFGVVRVLPDASAQAPAPLDMPTDSGVLMGTPRYLSPEGALGQRVDARADLYAAALMLYYMLTGRGPFDEMERDTAVLAAHVYANPPAPSQVASQAIRAELDAIVLKALRKDPASRYQTAAEFRKELDRFAAMLVCPPALQETTVLGDLSANAPVERNAAVEVSMTSLPSSRASEPLPQPIGGDAIKGATEARSSVLWLALGLFLSFGLLMAAVVAWLERSQ